MAKWLAAALAAVVLLLGRGGDIAAAQTPPGAADAVARAGRYIVEQQTSNGAVFDPSAKAEVVADAVVGMLSAGVGDEPVDRALAYVGSHGPVDVTSAGPAGRVILAIVAAGSNPRDFSGVDYVGRLLSYYNPRTGGFDQNTDHHAFAMLGLLAAEEPAPAAALRRLRNSQCPDGGFARTNCLTGVDVETTALAVNVLSAHGISPEDLQVSGAIDYLRRNQDDGGGFAWRPGEPVSAVPTGAALAALIAAGEDLATWRKQGGDPVTALIALQDTSGGLRASEDSVEVDGDATARALPGLTGRPLPLAPASRAAPSSPTTATTPRPGATTAPTLAPGAPTTRRDRPTPVPTRASVPLTRPDTSATVELALPAAAPGDDGGFPVGVLAAAGLFAGAALGVLLRRRART